MKSRHVTCGTMPAFRAEKSFKFLAILPLNVSPNLDIKIIKQWAHT